MDFDKSKVYTPFNADQLKDGSKGYFNDNASILEERVRHNDKTWFGTVEVNKGTETEYHFHSNNNNWRYFYLVEEPKSIAPYNTTDDLVDDFCKRFKCTKTKFGLPFIWVKEKDKDIKYMVVQLTTDMVWLGTMLGGYTLKELYEMFTYLDGSPIGERI